MTAQTREVSTLQEAAAEFVRHRSPQLLTAVVLVLAVVRALWPAWSLSDLVVVTLLVGAQPFTEWVIHVTVLHCPANGGLRDPCASGWRETPRVRLSPSRTGREQA